MVRHAHLSPDSQEVLAQDVFLHRGVFKQALLDLPGRALNQRQHQGTGVLHGRRYDAPIALQDMLAGISDIDPDIEISGSAGHQPLDSACRVAGRYRCRRRVKQPAYTTMC
jgi:hypothetical protein